MTDHRIIPVTSEYERLVAEIRELRALITHLTALRDDLLYHVCPALKAIYERELGCLEREILAAQMYLREKQRILEILRAQMNRREEPSYAKAEKQAGEETRSFEDELRRKAEEADDQRKRWEKTSWAGYGEKSFDEDNENSDDGSSDSGRTGWGERTDGGFGGEERSYDDDSSRDGDETQEREGASSKKRDIPGEIKKLYKKIVKRLHPDANPDITEHEKELFLKAREAYENGDLAALERIWEEIEGTKETEEQYSDTPEDIEKLKGILKKLKELAAALRAEIAGIRGEFPYTMKELLENEDLLRAKQEELRKQLEEIRKADEVLAEMIRKVRAETHE